MSRGQCLKAGQDRLQQKQTTATLYESEHVHGLQQLMPLHLRVKYAQARSTTSAQLKKILSR